MLTLFALFAAVAGLFVIRLGNHDLARALTDAGDLALVLAFAAGGAWLVATYGNVDGTSGALAGTVVGTVVTQLLRDRRIRR